MQAIVTLGLAITLSGCLAVPAAHIDVESQENWHAFVADIAALKEQKQIPGLAVAVVEEGAVIGATGFGFADANHEVRVTEDTPFWIASVTKTFVGLTYLHLEAEGKVDFSEQARKTPDFTGLCEWLASTTIPFAKGLDCSADITIQHILNHQVNAPVGTQFMYNPIMYSRLSRHLEYRFGEGIGGVEGRHHYLGQTIDRTILEPAQMTRSMGSMWDRTSRPLDIDDHPLHSWSKARA